MQVADLTAHLYTTEKKNILTINKSHGKRQHIAKITYNS